MFVVVFFSFTQFRNKMNRFLNWRYEPPVDEYEHYDEFERNLEKTKSIGNRRGEDERNSTQISVRNPNFDPNFGSCTFMVFENSCCTWCHKKSNRQRRSKE